MLAAITRAHSAKIPPPIHNILQMVTKGIPWDDLPNKHKGEKTYVPPIKVQASEADVTKEERNAMGDLKALGKRGAFGLVCGGLSGAAFGFIDILRDAKAMSQKKSIATAKMFQYTYKCGGFFASYHATRKALKLYYDPNQSNPENMGMAAGLTVAPLITFGSLRPMLPYAAVLIALDAINGWDDDL